MTKITKWIKQNIGINEVMMSLYFSYILTTAYTLELCLLLGNKKTILFIIASFVIIFLAALYPSYRVLRFFRDRWIEPTKNIPSNKCVSYLKYFIPTILVLGFWYILHYPGIFSPDPKSMIQQVISGQYDDWHPVLYTLIAFTIPLKLTNGNIAFVVIFQIVEFSAAFAFMEYEMSRYRKKYAIISMIIILINPITWNIMLRPWKDVGFAITTIILITFALMVYADPEYRKRKESVYIIAVFVVMSSIFRHNGILFTLPYSVAICLKLDKKNIIKFIGTVVLLFFGVKFVLYPLLSVSYPGRRVVELMGLPMKIIGNVTTFDPEALDQELADFVYAVASREDWVKYFSTGNFNTLKSNAANLDVIENAGVLAILRYMFKAFRLSPARSIEGMLSGIVMVTSVTGPMTNWGMDIIDWVTYYFLNNSLLRYILLLVGTPMLISIIATLSKCELKNKNGWFKFLICLSMVCYNMGTMLLLTGPDYRFFFYTFVISPTTIMIMFIKEPVKATN